MQARIGDVVVAEATDDQIVGVEGNRYFPSDSVNWSLLQASSTPSSCPWKGQAQYWNANIPGGNQTDVAWSYPTLKPSAVARVGRDFTGYVAFDRAQVNVLD